jgi:hypothetical protein
MSHAVGRRSQLLSRPVKGEAVAQGVEEQRGEQRVRAALRVALANNGSGITRDVSASGMFFETDAAYERGSAIDLTIDIDTPGGPMVLSCRGQIVRVERRQATVGVAVRFLESTLKVADVRSVGAAAS